MNETASITDKQLKIIEAAGKILSVGGIGGLTTKNLGKEMQSSESAIYRHFASKEDIIVGMLNYLAESLDEKYTLGISKSDSPDEKFIKLFQLQFDYFTQHPHFVLAVFSDGLLEESDKINEAILGIMTMKHKHLFPIIQDGQTSGAFTSELPIEDILHISMGAIRLQMFKWRVAEYQFDLNEAGNKIVHSVLNLIKTK
jgi:TetR/AcrR family fatty acid metabolism transcriptional regulator|tara:strand:+ start:13547 stop:14143 length:597 start_codon:yes stop_codon:yes gene_type:complete